MGYARITFVYGLIDPLKGLVNFASHRVNLGDLVGRIILIVFNVICQCRVSFFLFSQCMIGQRQSQSAPARLQFFLHLL